MLRLPGAAWMAMTSLYWIVFDGPKPEALRDRGGGEGDGAGHLHDDDDNCGEEEQGDPPWHRASMIDHRGVEEEKNKGGQDDGARPRDHRLDAEDEAFRSLT